MPSIANAVSLDYATIAAVGAGVAVPALLTLDVDEWSADPEAETSDGFIVVEGDDVEIDTEALDGEPVFVRGSQVYTEVEA